MVGNALQKPAEGTSAVNKLCGIRKGGGLKEEYRIGRHGLHSVCKPVCPGILRTVPENRVQKSQPIPASSSTATTVQMIILLLLIF